jgi:hypothetical protein
MIYSSSLTLKLLSVFALSLNAAEGYTCVSSNGRCCFGPDGSDLSDATIDYNTAGANSTAAHLFGSVIGNWCVDFVQDFSNVFSFLDDFNEPLTNWNTSSALYMDYMFEGAASFNQPLNFDTSHVTLMPGMFAMATSFNQPLKFVTVRVTDMSSMFANATAFNQPLIGSFKTRNVFDMSNMFDGATAFNQPFVTAFNTNKVTSFKAMFHNAIAFNHDVSAFKVGGSARDFSSMFQGAVTFKQNLKAWSGTVNKTSKVTKMFKGTACPTKIDPKLNATKQGPFCYAVV